MLADNLRNTGKFSLEKFAIDAEKYKKHAEQSLILIRQIEKNMWRKDI